jgi:site-specific recombinase XerD
VHQWLKFKGRFDPPAPPPWPWQSWIDQFTHYMIAHKAFSPDTQRYCRRYAREFLQHVFGNGRARWRQVQPAHVWRYAEDCARRLKPTSAKLTLSALRIFLRFVQLRGACSEQLRNAVPPIACFGQTTRPATLSEVQCRRFLASFSRRHPGGQRDAAIALCMLDLGLRAGEVARLRLPDIDWQQRHLTVPIIKRGRARRLPLPERVFAALHAYVNRGRPVSLSDRLFVRHADPVGEAISVSGVRHAMRRGYARAGLPPSWCGTHRLRHTFATRLLARGIGFKPLADLMGHRRIDTTFIYTHADLEGLRQLAQPWPL